MKEALLYEKLENRLVHCFLCAHHCRIADKKFGFCGVRQNIDGALYTHVYGKPIAMHVDPVEKKPLYHFLPGSTSFSIATIGCNFHCGFCQNWEISQARVREGGGLSLKGKGLTPLAPSQAEQGSVPNEDVRPQDIVQSAIKNNCKSISYTYTEPTIFFEYALDIAKLAKEKGLYNVFVTNGYMTKECLEMIKPYLDAANVDLKFFNDASYKKICAGSLEPVLDSIRLMHELGIWVEVTTLIITGENDSDKELTGIAEFISGIDKNTPWHISRFHPDYKFMDHQATSLESLKRAGEIGRQAGLNFIYLGNIGFGNDTHCPSCKKVLIKREYFSVLEYNIEKSKCVYCGQKIAGLF